ncbi:MAG: hypothetical protein K8T20_20290 [Planctomycetes bacterium]|nr:hypothetical protein [Planctomycetota bacterium]
MRPFIFAFFLVFPLAVHEAPAPASDWSLRGEVVDASATDGRFFIALRFTDGQVGGIPLDGARVVLAGDRGKRVVVFDPSVTEQQRFAVESAVQAILPLEWAEPAIETRRIDWDKREGGLVVVTVAGRGEFRLEPDLDSQGRPVAEKIRWGTAGRECEGHRGTATFSYTGEGLEVKDARGDAVAAWVEVEHWAAEER